MRRSILKHLILGILLASLLASTQFASAKIYRVPSDFTTIQEAIDDPLVRDGDTIKVSPGNYAGALITKAVRIRGTHNTVIDSGPLPWSSRPFMAGFLFNDPNTGAGSGAKISHLRFEYVEFPVFSRGADHVTVSHCRMDNAIQGISNWHGSRWIIRHNRITDLRTSNGGGIGILIGARFGGYINCNLVSHNRINGILYVDPDDGGGYNGTGIVLYADFRWGFPGADEIAFNYVIGNRISLISDTPDVVDVCAIELTDTRDDPSLYPDLDPVIYNNVIGFNNLLGTELQIVLTPENLADYNYIFRNLGVSRCRLYY